MVSLLRDWLCRPGERLLDLKEHTGQVTELTRALYRHGCAIRPFGRGPLSTPLPDSAEAARAALPSRFRRNLRVSARRLAAEGVTHQTIRSRAVADA